MKKNKNLFLNNSIHKKNGNNFKSYFRYILHLIKIYNLSLKSMNYLIYTETAPLASFSFNSESVRLTIS